MRKQLQAGLVVEGNTTESAILRLPSLKDELGPVKSVGLQVATRISNFLRAGYGVSEYRELESATLILLRLPEPEIPRVVAEICQADLTFEGKSFVLCETWQPTEVLKPLMARGAAVASLVTAGPHAESSFVLDGDKAAVRRVKRLIGRGGGRAVELKPGAKSLYFAANLLATALPSPLFQLASQTLRESGVEGNELTSLLREWWDVLGDAMRKGSRAPWGGPLTQCSDEVANEHLERLMAYDAKLAETVKQWLSLARRTVSQQRSVTRARGHGA